MIFSPIPLYSFPDSGFKIHLWPPSQLVLQLGTVYCVPQIVPFSVRNKCYQTLRLSKRPANKLHNINICHLVAATNIIDLSVPAMMDYHIHRPAMVIYMDPIANIYPLSLYRQRLILKSIKHHKRNQLLRELAWSVIIRTSADSHRQAISSVICHDHQVCSCLGAAVW